MNDNLKEILWAKTLPYKKLYTHMLETGMVSRILLEESCFSTCANDLADNLGLSKNDMLNLVSYITSLHDIGKAHPLMQGKAKDSLSALYIDNNPELKYPYWADDYRHELGSYSSLKRIWKVKKRFSSKFIREFASTARIHHQGKEGRDYPFNDAVSWPGGEEWINQQNQLEELFYSMYSPPYIESTKHLDAACIILTGITILSDWIASSYLFEDSEDCSNEERIKKIKTFIDISGLGKGRLPNCDSFNSMWKWIDRENLRPLQNGIEAMLNNRTEQPLITIIEAPMGEGKTEAGLFAAMKMAEYWGKSGFYIALPTSATANQMIRRVESLLNEHGISGTRLIHSMSWLNEKNMFNESEEIDDIEASRWLMSSKRSLLASYAVGTIDQAMMSALQVKYGVIRLLGLTGKVLIIDEIHAYDAYMSSIIMRLLEWCRVLKIPVVMLSATLPLWKKKEILSIYGNPIKVSNNYQLITAGFSDGSIEETSISETTQKKTIETEVVLVDDIANGISDIISKLEFDYGCICILVNTVKCAQQVYDYVKEMNNDIEVYLFHSKFHYDRRQQIENKCIELFGSNKSLRPRKAILVATQVVEQSLDLDFDYMITEVAPVDLILQRAGRLHRHADTKRSEAFLLPKLTIVKNKINRYGATEKIYYKLLLDRTIECLNCRNQIMIPEDIPRLVDYVYQKTSVTDKETEAFLEQMFSEQLQSGMATGIELRRPDAEEFCLGTSKVLFQDDGDESWASAKTRLSEDTVRIAIIPDNLFEQAFTDMKNNKYIHVEIAKKIIHYSVSISKREFSEYMDKVPLSGKKIVGTRRLSNMFIFPSDCEKQGVEREKLCCSFDVGTIVFDNDRGVIFKKGGENNYEL